MIPQALRRANKDIVSLNMQLSILLLIVYMYCRFKRATARAITETSSASRSSTGLRAPSDSVCQEGSATSEYPPHPPLTRLPLGRVYSITGQGFLLSQASVGQQTNSLPCWPVVCDGIVPTHFLQVRSVAFLLRFSNNL